MAPLSKSDLDAITTTIASSVAQAIAQAFAAQPKAMAVQSKTSAYRYGTFLPKGAKADPASLEAKDAALTARFLKRGFSDVQLMDRTDPAKPFNVRPFKGWLDNGRIVRKGQKGVKGLFHITQTDPLPAKTAPKAKKTKTA